MKQKLCAVGVKSEVSARGCDYIHLAGCLRSLDLAHSQQTHGKVQSYLLTSQINSYILVQS